MRCYKQGVLDELPSLEIVATAIFLLSTWRLLMLLRGGSGLLPRARRVESARARDIIGLLLLAGVLLYTWRVGRASLWLTLAAGGAIVAQLVGLYLRRARAAKTSTEQEAPAAADDDDDDDAPVGCPSCGHARLIELSETSPLLASLARLTAVTAAICPRCGALSGQVEDPTQIPIGPEHGTLVRQSPSSADLDALEEPAEHDG